MEFSPYYEFERLPARDNENAEFDYRQLKIQALSYDSHLLHQIDTEIIDDYRVLLQSDHQDPQKIEEIDALVPEEVKRNYDLFSTAFAGMLYDPNLDFNDERVNTVFRVLGQYVTHSGEDKRKVNTKEIPSLGEYLVMISNLDADTREDAANLEIDAPIILSGMQDYLSKKGFLDEADFRSRLAGVKIAVIDPLSFALYEIEREGDFIYGGFQSNDFIAIKSDANQLDLIHTLIHEVLHQVSGKTRLRQTVYGSELEQLAAFMSDSEEPIHEDIYDQRVGLYYLSRKFIHRGDYTGYGKSPERFRWLNEAITAFITDKICNHMGLEKSGDYPKEGKLLTHIVERSNFISRSDFIWAYFEDYKPDQTNKIPDWKQLNSNLSVDFGPNFLLGVDKALDGGYFSKAREYVDERAQLHNAARKLLRLIK